VLWIALEFPSLPLQRVERGGSLPVPVVISEGAAQRPVVACANRAARDAGIREGQAVAAAKALAGELRVVARDLDAERDCLERLAAWASQFTPMSCVDGQGIALEVETTQRLFNGHAKLIAAIRRGIHALGLHATLGVAPTPGDIPERIAGLPLFLMDWPDETLARLTDLGVLRFRDIAALPAEGIARRFGPAITVSLDRVLGKLADPRLPYQPPARFRTKIELPAPADGVEALLFPLRRLLAEFEGAMRGRGSGVQHLAVVLDHGHKSRTHLALDFSSTEREAEFILAIAREKLGRLTLRAPTLALELRAEALLAYVPREATWLPGAKEQALDRDRLIERLSARLGSEKVFGIAIADDHRPELNWKKRRARRVDRADAGSMRPAFLLNRPQRLILEQGTPVLQGALELVAGPERIESGWWDGEEVSRDYYVALNPRGESFWIYREHHAEAAWYLHGIFA